MQSRSCCASSSILHHKPAGVFPYIPWHCKIYNTTTNVLSCSHFLKFSQGVLLLKLICFEVEVETRVQLHFNVFHRVSWRSAVPQALTFRACYQHAPGNEPDHLVRMRAFQLSEHISCFDLQLAADVSSMGWLVCCIFVSGLQNSPWLNCEREASSIEIHWHGRFRNRPWSARLHGVICTLPHRKSVYINFSWYQAWFTRLHVFF